LPGAGIYLCIVGQLAARSSGRPSTVLFIVLRLAAFAPLVCKLACSRRAELFSHKGDRWCV